MSERERLIELLKQNCHCKDEDCSNCNRNGICFTHREADYLLENGVIAPTVGIGDTVYHLGYSFKVEKIEILKDETIYKCGNNDTDDYMAFHESDIGKTVFLTKEAAEKAVKGSATNE